MHTAKASFPSVAQQVRDLLNEKAAAAFLDVEPGTLSVWRSTGRYGIPFVKVGHLVRYRRTDLEDWLQSRTRTSGSTE
jgi:predicted site-specific integrase-resolvase